jgi:hypothetical protein
MTGPAAGKASGVDTVRVPGEETVNVLELKVVHAVIVPYVALMSPFTVENVIVRPFTAPEATDTATRTCFVVLAGTE